MTSLMIARIRFGYVFLSDSDYTNWKTEMLNAIGDFIVGRLVELQHNLPHVSEKFNPTYDNLPDRLTAQIFQTCIPDCSEGLLQCRLEDFRNHLAVQRVSAGVKVPVVLEE